MGLEGLEAKEPAPAEVTLALARVAHEHRAIVADGLDAVGHGRHRIISLATCPIYLRFKILDACT